MKDEQLRELLDIKEERWGSLHSEVLRNLTRKVNKLFVDNYFKGCACCAGTDEIFIGKAVKFERLIDSPYSGRPYVVEKHTTPEGHKAHETIINEWAKEVAKFKKEKPAK